MEFIALKFKSIYIQQRQKKKHHHVIYREPERKPTILDVIPLYRIIFNVQDSMVFPLFLPIEI